MLCGNYKILPMKKKTIIEGFGGKRAVGFLLKIELCQKRSKFHNVVLIRCVKECSVCFLAEVCLVFEILCMQKAVFCGHVSM